MPGSFSPVIKECRVLPVKVWKGQILVQRNWRRMTLRDPPSSGMRGKSGMHSKLGFFPLEQASCQLLLRAAAAVHHRSTSTGTQMENWLGWLMTGASPKLVFVICGKRAKHSGEVTSRASPCPRTRDKKPQQPTSGLVGTTPGHPQPPRGTELRADSRI